MNARSTQVGALRALGVLCAAPAFAQGGDTCAAAVALPGLGSYPFDTTSATTSGFNGGGGCAPTASAMHRDLFWTFIAPADGNYEFDTFGSSFDTLLTVHRGAACGATCIDHNDNFMFLQSRVRVVGAHAGDAYLVQVGGYLTEYGAGSLQVSSFADACAAMYSLDYLEGGDDCASALPIGPGTYAGLQVSETDPDFYSIEVASGATVTIDARATYVGGDLTLYLWDPLVACDRYTSPVPSYLAVSANNLYTGTFDERVRFTNSTPAQRTLIVHLRMESMDGCAGYDLLVDGALGALTAAPLGASYCAGVANSTGLAGQVFALGSERVIDDRVTLLANQLPRASFGYFLTSRLQGLAVQPGGSQGNLCLAGAVGRFVGPLQIQSSGEAGTIRLVLELGLLPQPSGTAAAQAGEVWNFQLWHRDSAGGSATSNFTSGLALTLQ
ncbi:MAG: hypothetical protein R3F49_11365 [Planctomycetota bacterium]